MRSLINTDIFEQTKKTFNIERRVGAILSGVNGKKVTFSDLETIITNTLRTYKDAVFIKAIENIKKGNIIIVYNEDMANALPPFMPFIKFSSSASSAPKVLVDMSYLLYYKDEMYSVKQLESVYALLSTAELTIDAFGENAILPSEVIEITSLMWARMFCKVLNRLISLNINKEKYDAFIYFSIQFYCRYILETPSVTADNVAASYLKDGKGTLINNIEGELKARGLNMYNSFNSFCNVLFDNELTGVHTGFHKGSEKINYVTYMSSFMHEYDKSSLYALASFPYFWLLIMRVNVGSRDINYRSLQDIMMNQKIFVTLIKELQKHI